MRHKTDQNILAAIALFLVLASCGPSPQAGGGIGGTGNTATVTSGPITGFGSVFVSGDEYGTRSTAMTVDGKSGTESDLRKGMVVLVNATLTHGDGINNPPQRTANTLLYEDTVEGIVQSVDQNGSSLVVLGQSVAITTATVVDATIPGQNVLNLVPGRDLVEVSGFVTGDGTIIGTFIDMKTEPPDYEVKGFIKNNDAVQKTFEIGSLTVDYRDADLTEMPSQSSNAWNGLLVDVRGNKVSSGGPGSHSIRITATEVELEDFGIEDGEDVDAEGFVTQVLGQGDFFLGNLHVQAIPGTTFEGGTLNDILVGAHLEVHGSLVGGIVNAARVEFDGEMELLANVATINSRDNTLTLTGLAGLVVQFDSKTVLHGQGNPRQLADLHSSDHLRIQGQPRGGNIVLAKEVERSDPQSNVQVQGWVTSAADPIVVLLGTSIDTTSIPESGFLGRSGVIGRSAFFSNLSSGKKVSFQGNAVTPAVVWTKATRKD